LEHVLVIDDILKLRFEESPYKDFLNINNENITYEQLHELAEEIADSFDNKKNINRIKLNFNSKKLLLASIFAINRLNKVPIIFPPKEKMLKNIDYDSLAKIDLELNDNNCIIQQKYKNVKIYKYNKNNVQCALFTTGSSLGAPSCVELTFENIYCSSINWSKIYKFSKQDIYLNILPIFHVAGLSVFFRSLYSNFSLVYKNYNKNNLHIELINSKATCLSLVPKMFNDIIAKNKGLAVLQSLQFIILGGDSITYDIFKKCSDNNIKIYASYGLTESSSGVAGFWVNQEKEYLQGFIGYPHFDTKIFVKNGNIGIKSKTIMKKYSSGDDTQGIYVSSDRGKLVGDKICFVGRNKDFIVSGGENINIKNIEDLLKKPAFDKEVILVSHKDDKWGEVPVVIYESKEESLDYVNKILSCCKKNLPKYMIPKYFISIKNIPRYDNLKVDYYKLKQYVRKNFK